MKIWSYIFPISIAKFNSKFNGNVTVKESFGQPYIEANGFMQSGTFLEKLYRKGLQKFQLTGKPAKNILVVGVAGGSAIKILRGYFPDANITAIEIDPIMIEIAKKFFKLNNYHIKLLNNDFFSNTLNFREKYDLILIDIFIGYQAPKRLGDTGELVRIKKMLSQNGVVIFNRLYIQKYIYEADHFLDKVREIFHDVKATRIYCNLLISARV